MDTFDLSPLRRRIVSSAIILSTVLQIIDGTITNVALPHMQAALGATRETVTWVLTSYIVATAVVTPVSGWVADRVGLKRVFLFSILGFVAASVLCGLATNLEAMVAFRLLQGASGAFLIPLGQTALLGIYPKERHSQAIALWGTATMVSPVFGPIIGGWLTDSYSWRWVFFINLPIGILAFVCMLAGMPRWQQRIRKFDAFGFAMLTVGILALQLMLDRGTHKDWFESTEIVVEAGIAIACLWMFCTHLAIGRTRLFEPALFRDRNFVSGISVTFVFCSLIFSGAALLPPMLQQLFGYPTISAGVMMAPRSIGMIVAMLIIGRISSKVDMRLLILIGIVLTAYSFYQMTGFSLEMDQRLIVISGFLQGIGIALCAVPANIMCFQSIPASLRPDASGLYSLARGIGGSIGVSVVTTVLARQVQISHADLAGAMTSSSPQFVAAFVPGASSVSLSALMEVADAEVNRQALMIAYVDVYHLMLLAAVAALPLLLLMRKASTKDGSAPLAAID
jgi:DHA2 family multidrug resistance protein